MELSKKDRRARRKIVRAVGWTYLKGYCGAGIDHCTELIEDPDTAPARVPHLVKRMERLDRIRAGYGGGLKI